MQVTFITDQMNVPEEVKGELIHFGSPRLRQLFESTRQLGDCIRLYEDVRATSQHSAPLQPWLMLNTKVSFQCDRKKDVLLSLGLNLIHGQIVQNFFEQLKAKKADS